MLEQPVDSVLTRPWLASSELVAAGLETDGRAGLTAAEAQARLGRFGRNELATADRITPWLLFTRQFANSMIVVLMIAAVITGLLGDLTDTAVIIAIVIVNAVIGFVQEYRADRALAALSAMTEPRARVVRDGVAAEIAAAEIVPGDLVLLAPGDVVAADVRLTEAKGLRISEAALTGESEPVSKTDDPIPDVGAAAATIPVSERFNMALRGTAVTAGRGTGLVVASGMSTELGRIAGLLGADHRESTPLQRRLAVLGRWLGLAALVVCAVVFVTGVLRGEPIDLMLLTAVSLAVAAIPEGLPVVVAVSLALGAQRMARRRALTRRLPAVETLGSVTVICTDKTGTLTENRMLVQRVWTPFGEYRVAGSGYAPVGSVQPVSVRVDVTGSELDEALRRLAAVGAACNDASLRPPPGDSAEHAWIATGDPTEASLLALAGKLGVERDALLRQRPRLAEIGFDANRRRMTTVHRHGPG
ncbi:MAG: cation-translocating P-type ATPase, partial [Actinomycetes bacterium]